MGKEMDLDSFRSQLDEHYSWPAKYIFKFIAPPEKEKEVLSLFEGREVALLRRPSKSGKYMSFTIETSMTCSEDVVMVYQRAAQIEGCISL